MYFDYAFFCNFLDSGIGPEDWKLAMLWTKFPDMSIFMNLVHFINWAVSMMTSASESTDRLSQLWLVKLQQDIQQDGLNVNMLCNHCAQLK